LKSKELFPAVFSRYAADYQRRLEEVMSRGEARGRQRVVDLIDARPGMRVLDLACGPGTLTRLLALAVAPGGEVFGVDLAPGMIELARGAGISNARFEMMDIEHLVFPDRSFDAAACGHGLQFAPDLDRALGEARRVLHPGARFAASVPVQGASPSPWSIVDAVVDRRLPPAPRPDDQGRTRETVADLSKFGQAAKNAGFATVEVEVVEEHVRWDSAEQLVSMLTGWWDCAARLEQLDARERARFVEEATATLRRTHPGAIETTGRNHVLFAVA